MRLGRVVMGALYVTAGLCHFAFTRKYASIMPDYLPAHRELVLISGAAEIAGGIGILIPQTRRAAAWGIFLFLIVVVSSQPLDGPAPQPLSRHPTLDPLASPAPAIAPNLVGLPLHQTRNQTTSLAAIINTPDDADKTPRIQPAGNTRQTRYHRPCSNHELSHFSAASPAKNENTIPSSAASTPACKIQRLPQQRRRVASPSPVAAPRAQSPAE